jgi:hypothetical protein
MEDLNVYINKYEKELTEEYRVDFSGTGYCLVTGCFKHSDETSAPINGLKSLTS